MTTIAARRGASSLAIGVGLAIFAAVMAILVSSIVHTMRHVEPVHATVPAVSAVAWGDRVFVGPGSLSHWLKVRGVGYSIWAKRHPPANKILLREKARLAGHKK